MAGKSSHFEINSKEESLKSWVGSKRPDGDILELSDEAKDLFMKQAGTSKVGNIQDDQDEVSLISDTDRLKIEALEKFIEALTGKKFKIHIPDKIKLNNNSVGWGLEYDCRETHYKQEKVSFSSEGVIKTADGREISFSLQ